MNKKYGCDVVEYKELITVFGQEFIDALKKFGVNEVLRLNRRKKGLTSSGNELACHFNVMSLVSTFGGRHKHGFLIEEHKDVFMLAFHSAWLSPEKNLVCVTPRPLNNSSKSKDVFFFMFSDDGSLDNSYEDIVYSRGHFLPMERNRKGTGIQGYSISHYRQAKYIKKGLTQEVMNECVDVKLVNNFNKKSLLTKKSFDEIQRTPYAKKMRDIFQVLPKNKKHARKKKKVIDAMSFMLQGVA